MERIIAKAKVHIEKPKANPSIATKPFGDLSAVKPMIKVAEIDPAYPRVLKMPKAEALLSLLEYVPTRLFILIVEITYIGKLYTTNPRITLLGKRNMNR